MAIMNSSELCEQGGGGEGGSGGGGGPTDLDLARATVLFSTCGRDARRDYRIRS